MNIQDILNQDPKVAELKQKYQVLLQQKNQKIMEISHIEAEIIKTMGIYETVAKQIVADLQGPPAPTEPPPETPVAPGNEDDGFAEAQEPKSEPTPSVIAPSAENVRPTTEE